MSRRSRPPGSPSIRTSTRRSRSKRATPRRAPSCKSCSAATNPEIGCCARRSWSWQRRRARQNDRERAYGRARACPRPRDSSPGRERVAMTRVVGIDLGTTNSCVAVIDGDAPVVIANAEGTRTTPSVVGFAQTGERLVGQAARRQAMTNAENTIYAVKRLMGRKFEDPEVQRHVLTCPYEVVSADNGDAHVRVRGRDFSPPEISALVLSKMRQTAEDWLGDAVTEAVITVPAYFDDAQRQATKDAGRIAGLSVLRIVNEPTAAALAYGIETEGAQRVAVYDLGGGTFDVSILELADGVFRVRSTAGDTFLGGEDFDNAIVEHLLATFTEQNDGMDLRGDRMALQRLKETAERAKIELSSGLRTEINLPFIAAAPDGPRHLQLVFARHQLESLVEPLVQATLAPCRRALEDAELAASDIDVVILVGGQTR